MLLSDGTDTVFVEVQFRTVAMDFWASLEHKLFYKYDGRVPDGPRRAEPRGRDARPSTTACSACAPRSPAPAADRRSRHADRLAGAPSYLAGLATTPRPSIRP